MNGAATSLEELYRPIQEVLEEVRATITRLWQDALDLVKMEMSQVPKIGGKLLRPALCLLSAGAIGGRDLRSFVRLATAFEALHVASLAHDDVIDRALLRRGNTALNALWDNHAAVLGGDYLVARAVEMLAEYGSCPVIANAITSVRRMAEGELYFFGRDRESIGEDECIMLARQKTASLFAETCSAPSFILNAAYQEALHGFGIALGIAFQIIDDLLDLTQPVSALGKPSCGDLVEGKNTLPILFLRQGAASGERERLDAMRDAEITDADRAWVTALLGRTGALGRTEAVARRYANQALAALEALPDSIFRTSMAGIVDFVLVRSS